MTDPTNAELVSRSRRGEASAWETLVRRHLRAAYSVALALTRVAADAEDLAQEAFMVAFERLDTCREPERFSGWLLQIVRTRGLNRLEQRRLQSAVAEIPSGVDEALPSIDVALRQRLLMALEHLNQTQREVVLLHDMEGWTHPEIAAALGTSEGMSRQHLFQARRILRTQLKEESLDGDSEAADHG